MTNYGNFRNVKFSDVWTTANAFVTDYKASGLYSANNCLTDANATTLFYLLYSEYGNSVIASDDKTQFKYQVFATIYEYGPAWEKKVDLQSKLRNLTDAELEIGSKMIYNHALNPSTTPSTDELSFVSEQTSSYRKKSKFDKYAELFELINTDVTRMFVTKFKKLFLQIVIPELPLWYAQKAEEEEEE